MKTDRIKAKLNEQKQAVLKKIEALNKDIRHEAQPAEKDFSEQATEAENDDVLRALFTEANHELRQINIALNRITQGEYENCARCGEKINEERLEALPYTELCIECAKAAE